MTETCVNLVGPVLADVSAFLEAVDEGRHPPLDQQRQKFRKALDDVKKKAAANPELKPVLHPLVYWIDEVLTNSKWTHASEWRNYILEFDYFDTRNAFEEFWIRAERAEAAARDRESRCRGMNQPYPGDDVLEVHFLCVTLGFQGKLFEDAPALVAWADRVRPLILPPTSEARPDAASDDWGLAPLWGDRALVAASWLLTASILLALPGFIAAVHQGRSIP